MREQLQATASQTPAATPTARPTYEAPRIRVMTEQEILNSFQITQSMPGWWATGVC
jgi:hypothetical protein